jgi:hypothetical protein
VFNNFYVFICLLVLQCWGLNLGPCTYEANTLPLSNSCFKIKKRAQAWWYISVIPALKRQEDLEFKPVWATYGEKGKRRKCTHLCTEYIKNPL